MRKDYDKRDMCTLVVLSRPDHDWPVIIAANRDEMLDRAWHGPGRHWADRGHVVAGRDELAGGTWLGLNDWGVVAGVLNRPDSLGPKPGFRSRGELPLEALDHAEAEAAVEALAEIEPASYRSFNMVIADRARCTWLRSQDGRIAARDIPAGVSMITAHDRNDVSSDRIRVNLSRFQDAPPPDPDAGEWSAWQALLADTRGNGAAEARAEGAMSVVTDWGFGTGSSSLIALPSIAQADKKPVWLFASGRPGEVPFMPVAL